MPPLATKARLVTTKPGTAPGPRGHLLLGSVGDLQRDPLQFCLNLMRTYGDVTRFGVLTQPAFLITHPDGVQHVLQENHRNYNKQALIWQRFQLLTGEGLITNDGDSWLRQRRLMQPAFHRHHLAAFGALMTEATVAMCERWDGLAQRAEAPDITVEMKHLTQRIGGLALFSLDLSDQTATLGQAFDTVNQLFVHYLFAPFVALRVPTPRNRRFRAALRRLDEVVQGIITQRRHEQTGDLLSLLLQARDEESGQGMTDRQLRDEVLTLLVGSYETTANALVWTWYLLSQHPDVEARLHAELDAVLGGHPPAVADLANLPYTRMVLEESMRLYPPAWSWVRNTVEDDEIGGYRIPAKSLIFLSPYLTHRHPLFWEQPEQFDPQRFTPERSAGRPRYAYFPFGGGPRLCLGKNFTLLEAPLILATVAQRYQLRLVPGQRVEPVGWVTLVPRDGLRMTLQRR
jgi:cytochrome P450